jgi:phosphoribosylaminoimidazole-succinocarboxamide synthase
MPSRKELEAQGIKIVRSGKVRDLYTWKEELWLVASDRISAFDVIMNEPIPGKGVLLTQMARFWFEKTSVFCPNHVLSYELPSAVSAPEWDGRVVRCKRAQVIPLECVVRGYVAGSGWVEYQKTGTIGGHPVPSGLQESAELPFPLFTPSSKAEEGHDENLTEVQARKHVGDALYDQLRELSLQIYGWARDYARKRGIIIADTKFEFGLLEDQIILIDEVLTPDSSRFWPVDTYTPGRSQPSFDKQFLRDYLESLPDWNKQAPAPPLPETVIQGTLSKYQEAYDKLVRNR